ncbi:MAG: hypothetical protein ABSD74_03245 [Rhizomicrobium sp.]
MIVPRFSINPADGSLLAVAVGAFLATVSGFVANQWESYNRRRQTERSAALLFGEILAALKLTLHLADETRGRGDPYGPVTLRLVKAALREAQTYDRNREALFDLRDPVVRAGVHLLLVRLTLALEAVLDTAREIDSTETTMRIRGNSDPSYDAFVARRDLHVQDRAGSFNFATELQKEIPPLLDKLGAIAKYSFEAHEIVVREAMNPRLNRVPAADT